MMPLANTETQRTPGRVVPFPMRARAFQAGPAASPVTQERLRRGADLLVQEIAAIRATRQFAMELAADLANGAEIEYGELTFDRELKVVRHKDRTAAKLRQVPARA
jgi:hypothetical protein